MYERDWQRRITDSCDYLGLTYHHETDSRRSRAGFPDLVIVGPGGVVFAELKAERGRVRPQQQEWIVALKEAGAEVHIWRPSDWNAVLDRLRALSSTTVGHTQRSNT